MNNWQNRNVSVGDWFVTLLLLSLPIINIIMLLVWAFSGSTPLSKSNFAKASLLWMLISIVLWVMLIMFFGMSWAAMSSY